MRICDDPNKRNQKEWKIPVDIAINENVAGLVERYLIDSWVNGNGWNLDEIADHRQRYRNSLQTTSIHPVYRRIFLETFEASVRYIIKFQSGATYYLETVFIRELAVKGEIDEFNLFTVKTKDIPSLLQLNTKFDNLNKKINSHDHILEQYIKPNLRAPAVAEEKLKLKQSMPDPVVDHVFKLAYLNKPPSITKLQEYVESIKHKAKPEIICRSRSTVSRWLKKIKISLVKLGYISAEVGDAFQHKIRDPYNDNIKEKSQKGYGSSGKDYDQ